MWLQQPSDPSYHQVLGLACAGEPWRRSQPAGSLVQTTKIAHRLPRRSSDDLLVGTRAIEGVFLQCLRNCRVLAECLRIDMISMIRYGRSYGMQAPDCANTARGSGRERAGGRGGRAAVGYGLARFGISAHDRIQSPWLAITRRRPAPPCLVQCKQVRSMHPS